MFAYASAISDSGGGSLPSLAQETVNHGGLLHPAAASPDIGNCRSYYRGTPKERLTPAYGRGRSVFLFLSTSSLLVVFFNNIDLFLK